MANGKFSNHKGIIEALKQASKNLIPAKKILPSDWAEKNIQLPLGNARPGPIRFDNAPFQRDMINAIKEPGIHRISLDLGAQTGKTTVALCISSYFIDHEPKSQIMVQPTEGDMLTFMETKLRPMLDANKSVTKKIASQRGRDGVNNRRMISYVGGWLMFSWAGSPKTLRSRSAPILIADEIDGYESTPEGDPVSLLSQRSASFGDEAILVELSTPTVKDASRIETAFYEGDQRRYFIKCPHCDHEQYLRWENVTWVGRRSAGIDDWEDDLNGEHEPLGAGYACENCGVVLNDGERISAIRNAEHQGCGWRAAKPFKGHASFHGPELLSTFRRMSSIVQSYLDKISLGDMQTFVNVSLAETYEEKGERVDPTGLMSRAEKYFAPCPNGVLFVTMGVDMQLDRLELEIVGWGAGDESWSLGYHVIYGDPIAGDVWPDLMDFVNEPIKHELGYEINVSAVCLDTGGTSGCTQAAYEFIRTCRNRKIFGIKGVPGWGRPIIEKPSRKQSGKKARKIDLYPVGVDEAKLMVMRRLAVKPGVNGYCHFPDDRGEDWYKQLTSEKLITTYLRGQPVRKWTKPDKARNEGVDCRVYATAALKLMNPNYRALQLRQEKLIASLPEKKINTEDAKIVDSTEMVIEKKPVEDDSNKVKSKRRVLTYGRRR